MNAKEVQEAEVIAATGQYQSHETKATFEALKERFKNLPPGHGVALYLEERQRAALRAYAIRENYPLSFQKMHQDKRTLITPAPKKD